MYSRNFKNFNEEEFLADVELIQWDDVLEESASDLYRQTCPYEIEKNWEQEVPVDYV